MSERTETAILAGGCFWGMQDLIRKRPGVLSTRVGYSGGDVPNATYRNHGTHAEAIEITFDPDVTSYREILEFFFQIHDPTTLNRQGNDIGTSYRSGIYYLDDTQRAVAEDTIADVEASGIWPGPWSPRSARPGRSGRPSPSTRTTWSASRTATRATSRGPTGSCPDGATSSPDGAFAVPRHRWCWLKKSQMMSVASIEVAVGPTMNPISPKNQLPGHEWPPLPMR